MRERKGLVYVLNNSQIWAAYDYSPPKSKGGGVGGGGVGIGGGGGVRALTRDQLLANFKSANGIDLDPKVVDDIFQSVDPTTGKKKYSDGQLAYHQFIFEMQLSAPYAGDDKQAYLFKWRKDEKARIADARAAKEAERKEMEAIAAAKEKRDAAGKVPRSASRGSRAP